MRFSFWIAQFLRPKQAAAVTQNSARNLLQIVQTIVCQLKRNCKFMVNANAKNK